MTVRERIFSIKLLSKREEYVDYFKKLGLLCEIRVVGGETCEMTNCDKRLKEKEA